MSSAGDETADASTDPPANPGQPSAPGLPGAPRDPSLASSPWARIQRRLEEAILTYGILAMAGLMIANVLTRSLLGFSLTFGEEISQFLIVVVCFVGLSYAASRRRHIRMTAFVELLGTERRRRLEAALSATTSALLVALMIFAGHYVYVVADLGTVSPVLQVPLYLVYLIAPLGFLLSAVCYAQQAWYLARGGELMPEGAGELDP